MLIFFFKRNIAHRDLFETEIVDIDMKWYVISVTEKGYAIWNGTIKYKNRWKKMMKRYETGFVETGTETKQNKTFHGENVSETSDSISSAEHLH